MATIKEESDENYKKFIEKCKGRLKENVLEENYKTKEPHIFGVTSR